MEMKKLGWNEEVAKQAIPYISKGMMIGRIASGYKDRYRIFTEHGQFIGQISGKQRFNARSSDDFPVVGDWVAISHHNHNEAVIHAILPRKSKFSRKSAGKVTREQIIAANIDIVFLVNALNQDFNLRRMERYLTLVWESGANPIIILSKADLCTDIQEKLSQVESVSFGVPVLVISTVMNSGLDQVKKHISEGKTIALLGSSGAGKSTLVNALLGKEVQKVKEVREKDDKGKHTTTTRELFLLPDGGIVIDTPGMRELQLWQADEGLSQTFEDVMYYANQCRFRDCSHRNEPGCAVRKALDNGELDKKRYENYVKMQKELAYLSRKENKLELISEKERIKKMHRAFRKSGKIKP